MNNNNDNLKNLIKEIPINTIVEHYINLQPKGNHYVGLCPFHSDTNPSLIVNPEKNRFNCYVCNSNGDTIEFVSKIENISFIQACNKISDYANLGMKMNQSSKNLAEDELYKINELVANFYSSCLDNKEYENARKYLEFRKINDETINKFRIGVSPKDQTKVIEVLHNRDINLDKAIEAGVLTFTSYGYYPTSLNKIVFPICNENNKIVGYSSRIYDPNDKSSAKYINSKESSIFKKHDILYNLNNAKDSIVEKDYVLVLEGFMDVIALDVVGINNAVATMGTAFTLNHLEKLLKYTKNIVIMYDGDNAGQKNSFDIISKFNEGKHSYTLEFVTIPEQLDPDEFVKKYGSNELLSLIDKRISSPEFFYKYKMSLHKERKESTFNAVTNEVISFFNSNKNLIMFIDEVAKLISEDSGVKYEDINKHLRNSIKYNDESFKNNSTSSYNYQHSNNDYNNYQNSYDDKHFNNVINQNFNNENHHKKIGVELDKKHLVAERNLIKSMIANPLNCKTLNYKLGDSYVNKENYFLRVKISEYLLNNVEVDEKFIASLSESEKKLFNEINQLEIMNKEEVQFSFNILKEYDIEKKIKYLTELVSSSSLDNNEKAEYSDEIYRLSSELDKAKRGDLNGKNN